MCCFNRQMPRIVNHCAPVVPPANLCGGAVMPEMVAPANLLNQNQVAAARAAIAQAAPCGGQCQNLCDAQVEVLMEPAIITAPNIINHHRRIEHIVPVITEDIHQYHDHHEFIPRPEQRIRQTFDSDVSIMQPVMTQPVTTVQPQLAPVEIDVIERFGVNGNQLGANPFINQGTFMNPTGFGQVPTLAGQTWVGR